MSNTSNRNEQFELLKSKANAEREKLNEPKYRAMFNNLLGRQKEIIMSLPNKGFNNEHYSAETKLLKKALALERESMIGGLVMGFAAFCSVRYAPRVLLRVLGGDQKIQALREAESKARQAPYAILRRTGALLIEGSFAFWAGWRGYHMTASSQSGAVYDDITKIPLCEGKSIVSDRICDEWTDLVNSKVPQSFWVNVDNPNAGLSDEPAWRAILNFSENCAKRKLYEQMLKKSKGLNDNDSICVPSPGVPENILELTKEESDLLLSRK